MAGIVVGGFLLAMVPLALLGWSAFVNQEAASQAEDNYRYTRQARWILTKKPVNEEAGSQDPSQARWILTEKQTKARKQTRKRKST